MREKDVRGERNKCISCFGFFKKFYIYFNTYTITLHIQLSSSKLFKHIRQNKLNYSLHSDDNKHQIKSASTFIYKYLLMKEFYSKKSKP